MEEDFEDFSTINAELRYLTLELMKIAIKSERSFEEVVKDFVDNVNTLHRAIENQAIHKSKAGRRIDG